ncbi:hypothetical protein N665_0502s0030 [Sinapis alba]|nr:hypothetical protein N665_0502s0030 [Sinapis alba]
MDIWLIAATAATGYIAKQLQNVTKGKGDSLESSSEETVKKQESPCRSLLSRLASGKKPNENKDAYHVDVPSTSGENSGDYEDVHSDDLFFGLLPETGHGYWKASGALGGEETELSSSFRQRRFVKRNQRYRRLTKPLSSMESCLMTRFHGEQMTMEDYLTSPFPSPRASVSRPLLVTDGARVISKSPADSLWLSQQQIAPSEDKAAQRNDKSKSRKHGLSDATVLLQIGISIGIMASFMARQAEGSKVKQELKPENVVHDLEGELKDLDNEKAAENTESISNIEAELEAELERLEINMNTSNMVEMEPDFEVEFAQGELIVDRVRGKRVEETESNQDPSGNSTPESVNYAVSPRELSLRLHKVINSRLEKRITELETALQESQRKVEQLVTESESKKNSWSRVWEAREVMMTYKSDSIAIEQTKTNLTEMQPLVMNLTGEALDAFNDSYDELMNINEDDSEDDGEPPQEMMQESSEIHHEDFSSTSPWSHHQEDDFKVEEQELLLDFIGLEEEDEENSDFESEMEKQLIKQIVEKTKQGSPVVLNAQKMLFLMEEESEQNLEKLDHI